MKLQTDLHRHSRTSAAWMAAFPLHDFKAGDLHTPPNLEVPLDAIDRAEQFPPFFLLGWRNDASFRRDANNRVIEYDWPRHSSTPVARISVRGNSGVMVEQPWNGERPRFSFGPGKTVGSALQYPLLGQQAFRDARLTHAGSDGKERVEPFTLDVREDYFANLLPRDPGLAYTLPVHGRTCVVEHPAGILRAAAIPCLPEESDRLRELLAAYLARPDAYALPWLPERLARGSFSHRSAVVEWKPKGVEEREDEFEIKLFVGPWRAAIDLVEHLGDGGWDFRDPRRPPAVLCFPQELIAPLGYRLDGNEARLPALLPPQEALGVTEGFRPVPLGDIVFRTRGGDAKELARLQASVDALYPAAPAEAGPWKLSVSLTPNRPVIGLSRSIPPRTPTVPVLFVLAKQGADLTSGSNWPPFLELTRENLRLVDTERHQEDTVFILPNLPFLNDCHDEEGFFHLLPQLVRYVEEEYGTAWLVECCGMIANYRGRRIEINRKLTRPRKSGW